MLRPPRYLSEPYENYVSRIEAWEAEKHIAQIETVDAAKLTALPPHEAAAQAVRSMTLPQRSARLKELSRRSHGLPHLKRVYAVSDLHVDNTENMEWLKMLPIHRDALLIVAGDVSDSLRGLSEALTLLQKLYGAVAFCPGNHDLWVMSKDGRAEGLDDSLCKLVGVLELCERLGVCHGPATLEGVTVVPLLSWYILGDNGAAEASLYKPKDGEDAELTKEAWSDHYMCVWPKAGSAEARVFGLADEPAALMAALNAPRLAAVGASTADATAAGVAPRSVVTFSHFLGRHDLLFENGEERARRRASASSGALSLDENGEKGEKIHDPNVWFNFSRVAGCEHVEQHLRELRARVHVHGHQHRQRDRTVDGVRYVSHCLAYPAERRMGLAVAGSQPKEVWSLADTRKAADAHRAQQQQCTTAPMPPTTAPPPSASATLASVESSDVLEGATAAAFHDLPSEVLLSIVSILLPPNGLADSPKLWRGAMAFGACSSACGSALAEACQSAFPAFAGLHAESPAAWGALLGGLHAGGCGRWLPCNPLRAVRPQQPQRQPVQAPPRLSGVSLCAVAPDQLCLYGGRSSVSADTRDATYLITITWSGADRPIAVWDQLQMGEIRPPARCYHTAQLWPVRRAHLDHPPMVVFGGAGEGEGTLNCAWTLERSPWRWRQLAPVGDLPAPRSSHLCVSWPADGSLVVHGGLGIDGVTGDVWLLRRGKGGSDECVWSPMLTSGGHVRRAHHAGGLVRGKLLVYSGQDERLLTVHNLASLCLTTATWSLIALPSTHPKSPMAPRAFDVTDSDSGRQQTLTDSDTGGYDTGGYDTGEGENASAPSRTFATPDGGGGWWGGLFRWGDSTTGGMSPLARIDGAATTVDGVGLLIFGGVKDDFGFVPSSNTWLLKGAREARAQLPAASQFAQAPKARACLGLCADGLRVYSFGGFDGEHDLDDLWCLSLLPPAFSIAKPDTPGGSATASAGDSASAGRYGRTPEEMAKAIEEADKIKARRAAQATVIHQTPSKTVLPIHLRVFQAGQAFERASNWPP